MSAIAPNPLYLRADVRGTRGPHGPADERHASLRFWIADNRAAVFSNGELIESNAPEVIAFLAEVARIFDTQSVSCGICHDQGTYTDPYTGEAHRCPACGPRQGGTS